MRKLVDGITKQFHRIFGVLLLILGTMVIVGWYVHSQALIQVLPNFAPMQYNTALGFLLLGIATLLIKQWPKIAGILGILVALLGILTLIQYIFQVNLGLDQLFMKHYIMIKTSHPGRMAPNTALCFSLSGIALLLVSYFGKKTVNISFFLAILVGVLGIFALLGYVSGVSAAYGWGDLTRMAVHTSIGFIIVSLALLCFLWPKSIFCQQENKVFWPTLVLIIGLIASGTIWRHLNNLESKAIYLSSQNQARLFSSEIAEGLERDAKAIQRLYSRRKQGNYSSTSSFESDVRHYIRHMPFLELVKENKKIYRRDGLSVQGSESLINQCKKAFQQEVNVRTWQDLSFVGISDALCIKDKEVNYLSILKLSTLLSSARDSNSSTIFSIILLQNGKELADFSSKKASGIAAYSVSYHVDLYGLDWDFRVTPTEKFVQNTSSFTSLLILILGAAFSVLLCFLVWLWQIAREKNNLLQYTMDKNIEAKEKLFKYSEELQASNKKIRHQANHDELTTLPNRRFLKEKVTEKLSKVASKRSVDGAAVMMIDLDGFKEVNDAHGHDVGDLLLTEIARRFKNCLREKDILARFGGDEFVLFVNSGSKRKELSIIANKLIGTLKEPITINRKSVRVGASIGIAIYPDMGDTFESLLVHADQALYLAKGAGKNVYKFFSEN